MFVIKIKQLFTFQKSTFFKYNFALFDLFDLTPLAAFVDFPNAYSKLPLIQNCLLLIFKIQIRASENKNLLD